MGAVQGGLNGKGNYFPLDSRTKRTGHFLDLMEPDPEGSIAGATSEQLAPGVVNVL